jgi:hypothetical protein
MKYKYLFLFLIPLTLISSCKKDEINDLNDSFGTRNYLSIEDSNMAYCFQHLDIIAKGLSGLSNNVGFKDILHNMVELQFDGDYNVLFNDLVTECNANSIDVINIMKVYLNSNGIDSSLVTQSLQAFNNIEGNTYYIQIYIPNFEELSTFSFNSPVSIAYYGDESKLSYDGYYAYNEALGTSTEIDEPYSEGNEVWVVSLNENVDNDGELITPVDPNNRNYALREVPEPSSYGSNTVNMGIWDIKVKERKENWCGGKSDVAIRSGLTYHNGADAQSNPYLECLDACSTLRGELLKQFSKKEINDGDHFCLIYCNGRLIQNWENGDYYNEKVVYAFVIFERDVFPAKSVYGSTISIINTSFSFRSNNSEYFSTALTSMNGYNEFPYFNGYTVNNSGIEMEFTDYN